MAFLFLVLSFVSFCWCVGDLTSSEDEDDEEGTLATPAATTSKTGTGKSLLEQAIDAGINAGSEDLYDMGSDAAGANMAISASLTRVSPCLGIPLAKHAYY